MRPTTESALLAMVIGRGRRLLFRLSERGNEAFFMVLSVSEILARMLHENFRLGT